MSVNVEREAGGLLRKILVIVIPILIILAFVIVSSILKAMKPEPEVKKRSRPVLAVMATMAVSDTVRLNVNVQGETRPRTEIDLVPEVAGKIVYVSPKFLSGGLFAKGDVLYKIDSANFDVAVIRAQASVARAQQVLTREEAEGEIARQDWADLSDGKTASDLTLRKPQLLEAQAGLQSALADLQNAQLNLKRATVRAPFAGRVREKLVDLGQYVGPGTKLGRIFSTDYTEIRLALNDADLARLDLPVAYVAESRKDAPDVEISATIGGKLRIWHGQIMRTDSTYDPSTRSLFAIAEVKDPYGAGAAEGGYPLAPGLFVDAHILGKTLENVIVIPRDGLRPEDKVYIVNAEGVATSHDVHVLDTDPKRAILASGIVPGDLVILSPMEKSQLDLKFKALDVNDPNRVLVEPKPDEEEDKDKADEGDDEAQVSKNDKKKKRRKRRGKKRIKGAK